MFDSNHQNMYLESELTERTRHFSMEEFCAPRNLMLLYDESNTSDTSNSQTEIAATTLDTAIAPTSSSKIHFKAYTKFKPKSCKFPDLMTCPAIWAFLHQSIRDFKNSQWQEYSPNLTSNQQRALQCLQ